jgi:hypothetical protein
MVYDMIAPEDFEFDDTALERMNGGSLIEPGIVGKIHTILLPMGLSVEHGQERVSISTMINGELVELITGRTDFKIVTPDGKRGVCEVKTGRMAGNVRSVDDVLRGRFTSKWIPQILVYADYLEADFAILICRDSGVFNTFSIELAEHSHLLKTFVDNATVAVRYVLHGGALPDPSASVDECFHCDHYQRACDHMTCGEDDTLRVNDPDVIDALVVLEQCAEASRRHHQANETIKNLSRGRRRVVAGEFEVVGGWSKRKDPITGKVAEQGSWHKKVRRIKA